MTQETIASQCANVLEKCAEILHHATVKRCRSIATRAIRQSDSGTVKTESPDLTSFTRLACQKPPVAGLTLQNAKQPVFICSIVSDDFHKLMVLLVSPSSHLTWSESSWAGAHSENTPLWILGLLWHFGVNSAWRYLKTGK